MCLSDNPDTDDISPAVILTFSAISLQMRASDSVIGGYSYLCSGEPGEAPASGGASDGSSKTNSEN